MLQDSEQFQILRQTHVSDQYPLEFNHIRRFCQQNVCSELEHEGSTNSRCATSNCMKRALQDDVGPFWANRGKKDPTYRQEHLYAEEPHWVLVRRAQDRLTPLMYDFDPFFVTRGKKDRANLGEENNDAVQGIISKIRSRNRRNIELRSKE